MKKSINTTVLCLLLLLIYCAPQTTSAQRRRSDDANSAADNNGSSNETEKAELDAAIALPPAQRVEKLKVFIASHPRSSLKTRATELLTSARAALGDERLQAGDAPGGISQFRTAITESPANMSDKLFAEVVSQIPVNLFVRGQREASLEAARLVETKVAGDAKRLLAIAAFYLRIEEPDEAARVSEEIIKTQPEMSEAHQALGAARHVALRLDDAIKEYRRALELNPKAGGVRRSLADLLRAEGKAEEALALYREQLAENAGDKVARAGVVLSLFDLSKREEAERELEAALQDDPRNLALLVGAAYWYAAHAEQARALELSRRALEIEPRYTWAQIALARSLIASRQPLEAERSLRFARQYGRFPTLDYEFATALAAAGLYDDAAEQLARSFTIRDGQIETQLAGRKRTRASSFIELLAPERRASIFQNSAADTEANARMLKGLLTFVSETDGALQGAASIKEAETISAAKEFTAGEDPMRAYRQLYVATRLLRIGAGLPTALEMTDAATSGVEAALDQPVAAIAIQAEELRPIYARAAATGTSLATAPTPRNVLSNIMRGRIEDLTGWALFNQDKSAEAVVHLRRAASVMPENTPWWRTAQWHLGAALEANGNRDEALAAYIKSYKSGPPDAARRVVIETLYRKINGSLNGLDERIGASSAVATIASNNTSVAVEPPTTTASPAAASTTHAETQTSESASTSTSTSTVETAAPATAETTPPASSVETPIPSPTPAPTLEPVQTPTPTPAPTTEATPIPTPEAMPTSTLTPEPSPSPAPTSTPTQTPETTPPTPTTEAVSTPTPSPTPVQTPEPTSTSSSAQIAASTPTASTPEPPKPSPAPAPTPEPTVAAVTAAPTTTTSEPTSEATPTPTPTTTTTIEPTGQPSPTPEPTPTPTLSPALTATQSPEPTPSLTSSSTPEATPSPAPETTPTPEQTTTAAPTPTPTPEQSAPQTAEGAQDRGSCTISLSETSLTIRPNGSAIVRVTLDGLTGAADIQPVSSDWANMAVFPEAVEGGAFRYSITSISKMTGTYDILFKSRCGSKSLTVKVK
jgi:tetratricopeptide (TPR) repeat protein